MVSPTTRLIVEVGSWTGRATRHLATLGPKATVIAIDRWQGSPRQQADPALAEFLPRLFDTFLSECWDYRTQIIPMRSGSVEGLRRVAEAGIQPDLVYLDGDHNAETVLGNLGTVLDLFPKAKIVGDDWDWEGVRMAVETLSQERGIKYENHGTGWRIVQ
jgi:hypothetical protein